MTPKMKEAAEMVLRIQADTLRSNGVLGHGILIQPNGELNMYAFDNDFMSRWQSKNKLAMMLIKEMFEHKGPLAFACEAWIGTLPPWMNRSTMPTDIGQWPAEFRSECLLCCVNQVGEKGVYVQQRFTRSKGQIVLGRIDWNLPASGRFVFDLRHRSLERALTDAALRTREGTSGIQ